MLPDESELDIIKVLGSIIREFEANDSGCDSYNINDKKVLGKSRRFGPGRLL